jgi:hypothetical protein
VDLVASGSSDEQMIKKYKDFTAQEERDIIESDAELLGTIKEVVMSEMYDQSSISDIK